MRLTKETAKDRIEVVAVPVGNNIEKTVHKTFLGFQTLSAENSICHIHVCIHDMGVLRSFLTMHCKYFRRIVFMVLWVIIHQMQLCPVGKIFNSFLNAWHVRKKPRNNGAGFLKPDGEKPAKEIHHLSFEFESSQDMHIFQNI